MKLNKTNLILWIFVFLSFLFFILSSVISSGNNKRKGTKTSLLNTKYSKTVSDFQIKDNSGNIELFKKNDIWFIKNNDFLLPSDSKKMERFISQLQEIRTIYKVSENSKKLDSFGLTPEKEVLLTYKTDSGETNLHFGDYDFSKSFRYFKTDKNLNIYEIDTNLDLYLSSSFQTWCEPYIFSRILQKNLSDSEIARIKLTSENKSVVLTEKSSSWKEFSSKLLELRHSGFQTSVSLNKTGSVLLESGNKKSIRLDVYDTENDGEYNGEVYYFDEENKELFHTSLKFSSWTYNKIFNLENN